MTFCRVSLANAEVVYLPVILATIIRSYRSIISLVTICKSKVSKICTPFLINIICFKILQKLVPKYIMGFSTFFVYNIFHCKTMDGSSILKMETCNLLLKFRLKIFTHCNTSFHSKYFNLLGQDVTTMLYHNDLSYDTPNNNLSIVFTKIQLWYMGSLDNLYKYTTILSYHAVFPIYLSICLFLSYTTLQHLLSFDQSIFFFHTSKIYHFSN